MTHPVVVRTTQAVSLSEQTTRCVYRQKLAMLKLHCQQQRRCPSWFKVNGYLLRHQNRLDPHINHVIVFPKWISKIGVTQSKPNVNISSVVLSLSLFFSLSVFLCFFVALSPRTLLSETLSSKDWPVLSVICTKVYTSVGLVHIGQHNGINTGSKGALFGWYDFEATSALCWCLAAL